MYGDSMFIHGVFIRNIFNIEFINIKILTIFLNKSSNKTDLIFSVTIKSLFMYIYFFFQYENDGKNY